MHTIELAVFDMAGTVVNEDNVVYKTLQKAINYNGYDVSLEFVLAHGAGKEKLQAIKDIIKAQTGQVDDVLALSSFEYFKEQLAEGYAALEVKSFEGVEGLISRLKLNGVKVALNTGYNTKTAQLLLDKMNWELGKHYDALVTSDDVVRGRPNPDMIIEAMHVLGVASATHVLKAGDSIIDIEEGKNANCGVTVGVTTGAHTKEQLIGAEPTYVLDRLSSIEEFILIG